MTGQSLLCVSSWVLAVFGVMLFPAASALAAHSTETVLYRFQGGSDGALPYTAPLVLDQAGNLYGTTTNGGSSKCPQGCGTVYELSPPAKPGGAWTETVIYSFQGGSDGSGPNGVLLDAQGNLIGTTGNGGSGQCSGGCGTLFQLTPPAIAGSNWTKIVLLEFPGTTDGFVITGLVMDSAGNLYGVNYGYEGDTNGAVAELTPPGSSGGSWTETALYHFKGVPRHDHYGDGSFPLDVTFDHRGNLFGATYNGGYCTLGEGGFCSGTVFELTPPVPAGQGPWIETMLYRFSFPDQPPSANVVVAPDGSIYGVSLVDVYGLVNNTLTVLHSYGDNIHGNGMAPEATPILDQHGNVYGTTCAGGTHSDGIAFELEPPAVGTTKWTQVVLHEFGGGSDGVCPQAPLIFGPGGVLYGTTDNGGGTCADNSFGCGTVFEIVP